MATTSELSTLRNQIQAIIAHHGGASKAATKGQFIGADSPSGSITYLTSAQFDFGISAGFLRNYNSNPFATQGAGGGPSED